jgi:hypothetical protein
MNKHVMTLAAFCSVVLAGCQQSEGELEVKEEYPVSIEASISEAGDSRYAGSTPNAVSFTNGDNIGLAYKVGTDDAIGFVKWTFDGNNWASSSAMPWKNLGENHTFYAFYPYGDDGGDATLGQVKMPVLTGQDGTMASVAARDFLVATKTMKYSNGGVVSFTGDDAFGHVSSLVVLTLNNTGDLTSAKINNITLTGTDLVAGSNYSFVDNSSTEADETGKVSFESGTDNDIMVANFGDGIDLHEDKTFYFVVNSGTIDLNNVTLSITYTLEGEGKYTATKTGLKNPNGVQTWFQKGCMYNYGITITTDKVLTISNHSIGNWGEGDTFDITIESEKQEVSE